MSRYAVITLLDSILGTSGKQKSDNIPYHCPFCNHHKRKLEVNIVTQHWHCWVCNAAGRKIHTLFRKLKVDRSKFVRLAELIEDVQIKSKYTSTNTPVVTLPSEYKPLWNQKTDPEFRNAFHYLAKRGITLTDILKYRIGYCDSGQYEGKIIIPSYDDAANLNYFVARAYYKDDTLKYKNPSISKNVVGFELHVDWKQPIVLVEGVFDAIAIRRNAIPLFGKTISDVLKLRLVEKSVKHIYICLDQDARKQALEAAEYFMANGIHVYFVDLPESDPADLGFQQIHKVIDQTSELSEFKLMEEKILCTL